jgi:hypothetical protein
MISSMQRIAYVSDSCFVVGAGRPLAGFVEHWARGRWDADRIGSCVRDALAEYARGTDPGAVAAALLALLGDADAVASRGIDWLLAPAPRRPRLPDLLAQHRLPADAVVVVTELVQPRPSAVVVDGVRVGVIGSRPLSAAMVGEDRVAAVAAHADAAGASLEECLAYGRAPTDLPLLRSVGVPVVLGTHPTLVRAARRSGWRCIDRVPGPPSVRRSRRRRPVHVPGSVDATAVPGRS